MTQVRSRPDGTSWRTEKSSSWLLNPTISHHRAMPVTRGEFVGSNPLDPTKNTTFFQPVCQVSPFNLKLGLLDKFTETNVNILSRSVLQYFAIYPTMLYLLHPILFYSILFYSTPLHFDSYITSSTLFYSILFHSIPLHLQLHFILFYSILFLSTPQ